MSERLYFDCNASFGPRLAKYKEERWTLEHLVEDLDLAGIAGALVLHAQTMHYDPMLANLALIREIEGLRDRLFPCWMALPPVMGDFPTVSEFIELARQNDVRAVRIEPDTFGLPVREGVWGELRDALLAENMLVIASLDGFKNDFESLDRFLSIFRRNNVLLIHATWSQWRWVIHLLTEYPKLHVEFSLFQANRAIEYIAQRFGAERCVFGTGLPKRAPGAARGFLDWTLLGEDDAGKVAAGNLRRLLRGAGPTRIPAPGRWHDALTEAARNGKPLPCRIFDDHCHVLQDGGCSAGGALLMHRGDIDGMIELMRRVGIDKTAMMSWAGPLSGDTDLGNEIVANAVGRYPSELAGVATVRPELQSEEEIEATIRKYHVELRFPGLKPFPRQTMDYDDTGYDSWFRFANDNQLYMVFDPATPGPSGTPVVEHLVQNYPDLGLHLDHCGKSWPYAKWAVDMVNRFPTVYAQLNYTLVTNGVIEYIVANVGHDRVLFGTDSPMRDPRPQVGWLAFTRLPEESKRKIFGENFERILQSAFGGSYAEDLKR